MPENEKKFIAANLITSAIVEEFDTIEEAIQFVLEPIELGEIGTTRRWDFYVRPAVRNGDGSCSLVEFVDDNGVPVIP